MPELPEVETVRRVLEKNIVGKKIVDVNVFYKNIIDNVEPAYFIEKLKGETFHKIERKGKYLIFILDHCSFIAHLRMEGKFFIKTLKDNYEKHEHLEFVFDDGFVLRYHDTRKFGRFYLVESTNIDEILKIKELNKLGPDGNKEMDLIRLYNKVLTSNVPIKTLLLDQSFIAGIGNIYADEILFKAKLHPETNAAKISLTDFRNIIRATKETLDSAIEDGGTTIRSYTSSLGVTGRFQQHLLVHTKEICSVCGSPIKKIKVGGRGTYYCPVCQKMKYPCYVIGLTGYISTGKTTVTDELKKKKYRVIDCDEINRFMLTDKYRGYKSLIKTIQAIDPDAFLNGELDKRKLREDIFNNPEIKEDMEYLIHPLVKDEVMHQLNKLDYGMKKNNIVFISAPLLLEAELERLCDLVLVLNVSDDELLERLMVRDNLEYDEAMKIVKANPIKERIERLEQERINYEVIDNSGPIDDLFNKIDLIIRGVKDED